MDLYRGLFRRNGGHYSRGAFFVRRDRSAGSTFTRLLPHCPDDQIVDVKHAQTQRNESNKKEKKNIDHHHSYSLEYFQLCLQRRLDSLLSSSFLFRLLLMFVFNLEFPSLPLSFFLLFFCFLFYYLPYFPLANPICPLFRPEGSPFPTSFCLIYLFSYSLSLFLV